MAEPLTHDSARAAAAAARARAWRLVRLGLLSTLLGGTLAGAAGLWILHATAADFPRVLVHGHAFAQLFGFVLPVAMGMALRLLPPPGWRRADRAESALFVLMLAGVVLRLLGYVAAAFGPRAAVGPLALAGTAALLAAVGLFLAIAGSGLLRRGTAVSPPDVAALGALAALAVAAGFDAWGALELARTGAVRAAVAQRAQTIFLDGFVVLLVGAVLARMRSTLLGTIWAKAALGWLALHVVLRAYAAAAGSPGGLFPDAVRHLFAVGFLAQLIFAALARFAAATAGGAPLRFPRARIAGGILLNVSVALRLLEWPGIYLPPIALELSAVSGALAWMAFLLLSLPVLSARPGRPAASEAARGAPSAPCGSGAGPS